MAQHSAVEYGRNLSDNEMKHITQKLIEQSNPYRTPDGKVIMHIFAQDDFDKLF
jgi:DNA mismatch repair ATPase MutL